MKSPVCPRLTPSPDQAIPRTKPPGRWWRKSRTIRRCCRCAACSPPYPHQFWPIRPDLPRLIKADAASPADLERQAVAGVAWRHCALRGALRRPHPGCRRRMGIDRPAVGPTPSSTAPGLPMPAASSCLAGVRALRHALKPSLRLAQKISGRQGRRDQHRVRTAMG